MDEYALIKDGSTVAEFKRHATPPVYNQSAKPWVWFPVSRVEGDTAGTVVDMDAGMVTVTSAPIVYSPRKVGTFPEFMDLFAPEVQAAIDVAAAPGSELSLLLKRGTATNKIDLESSAVSDALNLLVAGEYITEAERTEIVEHDFDAEE